MSLTYTTGNPSNLTAGSTANMSDIQGPFTDIKTWADAKFSAADFTTATLQTLGMNSGSQVGRGAVSIVATETRNNTAYGTLTTPDQVSGVVVPTNGLIFIGYNATWQSSVAGAGRAAVFIGANQLQGLGAGNPNPAAIEASLSGAGSATDVSLASTAYGLQRGTIGGYTGDITTGQLVGIGVGGQNALPTDHIPGFMAVFVAAGTYTVSIQFKATSGTVTAKNRKLWVWSVGF